MGASRGGQSQRVGASSYWAGRRAAWALRRRGLTVLSFFTLKKLIDQNRGGACFTAGPAAAGGVPGWLIAMPAWLGACTLSSESGTADDVCSKLDYPTDLVV